MRKESEMRLPFALLVAWGLGMVTGTVMAFYLLMYLFGLVK